MRETTFLSKGYSTEFDTPERCFIHELSNDSEDESVSIARARVLPGVTTAWHSLYNTEERYLIESGSGVAQIGDQLPTIVQPGDVVRIPAGCRQRITNRSESEDLVFLAICTPRFRKENYQSLE